MISPASNPHSDCQNIDLAHIQKGRRSYFFPWCGLILSSCLACFFALAIGSVAQADFNLIIDLRLPRVLTAFACGGLLALAGALLQALTGNALAEPYLLGVSGGASSGALLVMMGVSLTTVGGISVLLGASVGALLSMLLLFLLLRWLHDENANQYSDAAFVSDHATRLVLVGVMLATSYSALISLFLLVTPTERMPGMIFWMMGDLGAVTLPWLAIFTFLLCGLLMPWLSHRVNILILGEDKAYALGLSVKRLRYLLILIASVATASSVATAGMIGFVGMVVPHMLRVWWGNDQRFLLPASLFFGGTFLTIADLIARLILAPAQLPVGIITAFLGAPIFLWLLSYRRV